MKNRTYRVIISKDPDGGYLADIPTLKYCMSSGDTIEEAIENIREALEGVLEVMEEEGLSIPDDTNSIEYSLSIPANPINYSSSNLSISQ